METATPININKGIMKHLYADVPCPECGKVCALSLDMIRIAKKVICPRCKKEVMFDADQPTRDALEQLYLWGTSAHAQLHKLGWELIFVPQPVAIIYSRGNKP